MIARLPAVSLAGPASAAVARPAKRLRIIRQLLHGPAVAIGIAKEHKRSPRLHVNVADIDPPSGELRSGLMDVADHDLEVIQCTGR